jgi:hypothetical protein
MHASTLEKARYFLKTKHGISETYYSHSTKTPIFGNGQGAGDSPSQWCQQSSMLFDIYAGMNEGAIVQSPSRDRSTKIPLTAFADDTNLHGNDIEHTKSVDQLAREAQKSFTTWNELLHAAGHFMELEKCACYLAIWDFQEDGYAFTKEPEQNGTEITVTDLQGATKTITQLSNTTSQKLLGVMKNPIGNQQDEIVRLREKSNNLAIRINAHALSRIEAKLTYEAFYLPAMRYSLSITSINQMDLETVQRNATTSILAALGYNRHMLREVVYGSKKYQGLGMKHLYDLQGADSIKLFLQEINQQGNTTQQMLLSLLETIQLEAGIQKPILEETRPLLYIEWGWITSIRDFLHHIKAFITNTMEPARIYRINDSYLMDQAYLQTLSRKEQILINRCRLFLQVECISEITDATGTYIQEQWYGKTTRKQSRSIKKWPLQADPGREAWAIWAKFLQRAYNTTSGKLKKPLGAWIHENQHRIYDSYWEDSSQRMFLKKDDGLWHQYNLHHEDRRHLFLQRGTLTGIGPPKTAVPIDLLKVTPQFYITNKPSKWAPAMGITNTSRVQELEGEHNEIVVSREDIRHLLETRTLVDIATDGCYDPQTGKMSFGWVIAIDEVTIATGRGPAAGHPSMASSFRAEAYGLKAAAHYIVTMLANMQAQPEKYKCFIHLDSKALIGRMETYDERSITAKSFQWPDSDITIPVHNLLKDLDKQYQHVKSHQTQQNNQELSFPAKLNNKADELAKAHCAQMAKPHTVVTGDFRQMCIEDQFLTRDLHHRIMDAASKQPIRQYMMDKFGWKKTTFDSIHWELQHKVLMTYDINDQQRILKFVHDWLPTNARMHREHQSLTTRCPLCYYRRESSLHLFTCHHPVQRSRVETLVKDLLANKEDKVASLIATVIQKGLRDPKWEPKWESIQSQHLDQGILEQTKIGWQQIIFGRIARSLVQSQDTTTTVKLRQILRKIWDTFLALWQQRNSVVHDSEHIQKVDKKKQTLEAKIKRCFDYKDKLKASDRQKIFDKSKEELMQEHPTTIRNWIKMVESVIQVDRREKNKRTKGNAMMEQYFKWHPPDKVASRVSNNAESGSTIHVG